MARVRGVAAKYLRRSKAVNGRKAASAKVKVRIFQNSTSVPQVTERSAPMDVPLQR
jgi:hypothetical protein